MPRPATVRAIAGTVVLALPFTLTLVLPPSVEAAVTAPVRTSPCVNIPTLVNGDFEEFTNPADMAVTTQVVSGYTTGIWHGYAYGNGPTDPALPSWSGSGWIGPNQILYLHDASTSSPYGNQNVPGWRTTDSSRLVELQRQVGNYVSSTDQYGVTHFYYLNGGSPQTTTTADPLLSPLVQNGVSSASLVAFRGVNNYWDTYGPQPGSGTYWAELNALNPAALYQDIDATANEWYVWSLKHRGRTNTNEEMFVKIGPAAGSLVLQTNIDKYAPTNANRYSGQPTYGTSPSSVTQIIDTLGGGWNEYVGAYLAPATAPLRFQFEAGSTLYGGAFGNLLDDIEFTPFIACPVTQTLQVGQTSTVDVAESPASYGINQQLETIGNASTSISEFSTSATSVSFTPTSPGTFTVDYQVRMDVAGQILRAASRITYNVTAAPAPPAPPGGGSSPTPSATPLAAPSTPPTVPATQGAPVFLGTPAPGGQLRCRAPAFSPTPAALTVRIELDDEVLAEANGDEAAALVPESARPGQAVTCLVQASIDDVTAAVSASVTLQARARSACEARGKKAVVAFESLDSRLTRPARRTLTRFNAAGCSVAVTGYVEPTARRGNDVSLSKARAVSVAQFLRRQGASVRQVDAGRRDLQQACAFAENRCVIVNVRASDTSTNAGGGRG